jgi:hypothetical protein
MARSFLFLNVKARKPLVFSARILPPIRFCARYAFMLALFVGMTGGVALAQSPSPEKKSGREADRSEASKTRRDSPDRRRMAPGDAGPRTRLPQEVRQRFESLSPEEREVFQKNRERWEQMSEEDRAEARKKAGEFRDRAQRHMGAILTELGLDLDETQRREFARRYLEERRKIERELQDSLQELRKQRLEELQQKLKLEFTR